MCVPFNFPGTTYNKALRARRRNLKILAEEGAHRRAEKGSGQHCDLLDSFLNSEKDGKTLGHSYILENMLSILLAAHDTVAGAISLLVRNLCLYPALCQEAMAEHEAIAKGRNSVDDPVTWDDVQKMGESMLFLNETLRIASVSAFGSKRATEDVIFNSTQSERMLIPKGWNVLVWPRVIHLSSQYYPDPYKFDPSRFKAVPKPGTYIPFASGDRLCPGRDLAKVEVMIFLHRFLLSYEFEAAGPIDTPEPGPFQ